MLNEILGFFGNPGVNTISNIILVTALVFGTLWYAKKMSEQTAFMVKDRMRPQILDEVQKVLSPFIGLCYRTISGINSGYGLYIISDGSVHFNALPELTETYNNKLTIKDFYYKHPSLKEKIKVYNKKVRGLSEKIVKVSNDIKTPELIKLCREKVLEFNKSREEYKLQENSDYSFRQIFLLIILNRPQFELEHYKHEQYKEFWNQNREIFLQTIEKEEIIKQYKDISSSSKDLEKFAKEIRKQLFNIREKYREEYNISEGELKVNEDELLAYIDSDFR